MSRLIVNLNTGASVVVQRTAQENADARARTAQEAAAQEQERSRAQAEQRKRDILDQLAAKIEADPTILERIK